MTRPTLFLAGILSALFCYGQSTDTLILFYKSDEFTISKPDRKRLDSFISKNWDRISINGYTDETDEEDYNMELSKKRSGKVFEYLLARKVAEKSVSAGYFGELMPRANNSSGYGRALNRRTEIIGYRFRKITPPVVKENPMSPVTQTLSNGIIITYRPAFLPFNFEQQLENNLQLVTNTLEMRQNNLYNNTTRGEILSSVMIVCGGQLDPCKLDSPILIKVPIPNNVVCPLTKVKFFNATLEKGKGVWQEQNKLLYPEVIGGQKYIRLLIDDLCTCFNFDFKIDPDCFETDSTQLLLANAQVKNLTAELMGLNSVYLPRRINDSTYQVVYLKNKINGAGITFSLYNGKRRIRSFRDQRLTALPYDENRGQYIITTEKIRLNFPKVRVTDVVLKINGEKYRVEPVGKKYEFVYLKRKTEEVLVDFTIEGAGGRITQYSDQPVESIPYDQATDYRVIDKQFLKVLREAKMKEKVTPTSITMNTNVSGGAE